MRAFLTISFLSLALVGFSQNFVSPGIIAFHSGAFERTVQDMDKAFETSPDMDSDMRSKAHYYRGMARLNMVKAGSSSTEIGREPYVIIYDDLSKAVQLDSKWNETAQPEMNLIYGGLVNSGRENYSAAYEYDGDRDAEFDRLIGRAIAKLKSALKIKGGFEVNELLGKSYFAIGTFYGQYQDDQLMIQKTRDAYDSAIPYYETALAINPRAIESIREIKHIAYRKGDRAMEAKYAQMEANIGG